MDERPWLEHYDPDVPKTLEYPDIPLHSFLEQAAADHPDRACTVFNDAELGYAEIDELTDRLAAALAGLGVRRGDPVALFLPNIPQFVIAFYGILKAGGVVVSMNPLYTSRELEHTLKDSGVEIMLAMSSFYKTVKTIQANTRLRQVIVTNVKEYLPTHLRFLFTLFREGKEGHRVDLEGGDLWFQDLLNQYTSARRPDLDIKGTDAALFQFSGGTTGISKAAVAEHRHLVANTLQIRSWLRGKGGEDIVLMAIPLFHVYGLVAGMSFAVSAAASMVMVPNPRDLGDLLKNIDRHHPTIFPGVPTLYNAINNHPDVQGGKYDLSSIVACISGSAPLMKETKEVFEEVTGGKLVEGYGLSEAPTATHCNPIYGENRTGSIGLPFPDVECRIVSLEDEVTVLGPGEEGELVIRSPNVMRGYHNMPTETANSLRSRWLYTGDIATMDEDGYFYIVDRKKELIKPSGYQVWPREVEEVITSHPAVLEAGVAGVPDAYRGETVKAWVVLREGEDLSQEGLQGFCREQLAVFKVPSEIEFRQELPKTTVGKILRRVLVEEHMAIQVEAES
jgi:long-chain acyl-CoA synthetase